MKHKVITLCGSTKFKNEFLKQRVKLTLEGNIVLSPEIYSQSEGIYIEPNSSLEQLLFDMQLQRIDMSDEIFVINLHGYIGENTYRELEYAFITNKKVKFLEPVY